MTIQENVYLSAPVVLQNAMVSVKGLQLLRERKGGAYAAGRRRIEERNSWSRQAIQAFQLAQLNRLIRYAGRHVPYYTDLFQAAGLEGQQCRHIEDIRQIPVLDRRVVKEHPEAFLSRHPRGRMIRLKTTGTTGSPLTVFTDKTARRTNYAFFDAFLRSVGLRPAARHVVIGGRIICPPSTAAPPYWRHSVFQNALLMSAYHISEGSLADYLAAMRRYDPEYIEGYPSALFTIARLAGAGEQFLPKGALRGMVTSSETLHRQQRRVIEDFFGVPVYDQYGNAEMCCMVHQCRQGRYHVRSDYGVLEILDENNNPAAPGQPGAVICTGFVNYRMPLIRYRIGDRAIWSEEQQCPCGLATPILAEIIGREDDVIVCPDGRTVGRMSPVLKGLPILEAQYVQQTMTDLLVRVVPAAEFDSSRDIERVIMAVQKRLGHEMNIHVALVRRLETDRGGKLRNVISQLDTPHRTR